MKKLLLDLQNIYMIIIQNLEKIAKKQTFLEVN